MPALADAVETFAAISASSLLSSELESEVSEDELVDELSSDSESVDFAFPFRLAPVLDWELELVLELLLELDDEDDSAPSTSIFSAAALFEPLLLSLSLPLLELAEYEAALLLLFLVFGFDVA